MFLWQRFGSNTSVGGCADALHDSTLVGLHSRHHPGGDWRYVENEMTFFLIQIAMLLFATAVGISGHPFFAALWIILAFCVKEKN